jgi:hypothetical protein
VVLHETFGINAAIKLCTEDESSCDSRSSQVGSTEILTAEVFTGLRYNLLISYEDSVLALHSAFKECPHIVLEISIISNEDLV